MTNTETDRVTRNANRKSLAHFTDELVKVEGKLGIIARGEFSRGGPGTYAAMRVLRYLPSSTTPYVIHTTILADDWRSGEPVWFFERGFYYDTFEDAAAVFQDMNESDRKFGA